MNENAVSPEITVDDQAKATETLDEKPADAQVPGYEDALNRQDAAEGSADQVEEPVFLELEEGQYLDIPLFITKTSTRQLFGVRPGESHDDALDRLERQGE